MTTPASSEELLKSWYDDLRKNEFCHSKAVSVHSRNHSLFGISAIILSASVGSSIFASLEQADPILRYIMGALSIFAAILASIQTFRGYEDRAEKHHSAATQYGALIRKVELFLVDLAQDQTRSPETFDKIKSQIDSLNQDAPPINPRIRRASRRYFKRMSTKS